MIDASVLLSRIIVWLMDELTRNSLLEVSQPWVAVPLCGLINAFTGYEPGISPPTARMHFSVSSKKFCAIHKLGPPVSTFQ